MKNGIILILIIVCNSCSIQQKSINKKIVYTQFGRTITKEICYSKNQDSIKNESPILNWTIDSLPKDRFTLQPIKTR